jgi:hypothetical protein
VSHPYDLDNIPHHTCIVVTSPTPLDMKDFERFLKRRELVRKAATQAAGGLAAGTAGEQFLMVPGLVELNPYANTSRPVSSERLGEYMKSRKRKPFVLVDDWVPVDNLIAPMFEERFGYHRE